MQEERVHYFDKHALTPRASSIRLLAGVAGRNGIKLSHLDFQQAFVQASLNEVLMKITPGCGDVSGIIFNLNKSLLETDFA